MDAVHIHTSTANQMEHQTLPKSHILKTSYMAEKGKTMIPSIKSAHANDTEKKGIFFSNFANVVQSDQKENWWFILVLNLNWQFSTWSPCMMVDTRQAKVICDKKYWHIYQKLACIRESLVQLTRLQKKPIVYVTYYFENRNFFVHLNCFCMCCFSPMHQIEFLRRILQWFIHYFVSQYPPISQNSWGNIW